MNNSFVANSKISFSFENSKAKSRPIPDLKETLKNFTNFSKPFIDRAPKIQVENSNRKLMEFSKNIGPIIQKRLLNLNKVSPNSLIEYLINNVYLSNRKPIPINQNYYLLYDFKFKDQIEAISKIIICCLLMKKLIKDNKISQITNKCPFQYYLIFNSCRLPDSDVDKLLLSDNSDNKNVIIIYRNIFWMIEASFDYEKICEQLFYILSLNISEKEENFVGHLTAGERSKWAMVKNKFIEISPKNKEFISIVDSSMIVFNLDQRSSADLNLKWINKSCWFGKGCGRYFDKLFQFVILKDGLVAMNVQEGLIDQSICEEFSKIIKEWSVNNDISYIAKKHNENINLINYFENYSYKPIKLNYDLDESLISSINEFKSNFEDNRKNLNTEILFFNDFGLELFAKKGVEVSSFIQMAVLSCYYRLYNKIVASRQFVCGRGFAYGITEWIRTTSKESSVFSIALSENKIPRDLKIKLGLDAFKQFKYSSLDVINGKSIDSHFLGLSSIMSSKEKLNTIFDDYIYKMTSHWIIDTYRIFQDSIQLAAHPPSCKHGISISYIVRKDHIQFVATGFHDLSRFFHVFIEILREMKDLFIEKDRYFPARPRF